MKESSRILTLKNGIVIQKLTSIFQWKPMGIMKWELCDKVNRETVQVCLSCELVNRLPFWLPIIDPISLLISMHGYHFILRKRPSYHIVWNDRSTITCKHIKYQIILHRFIILGIIIKFTQKWEKDLDRFIKIPGSASD